MERKQVDEYGGRVLQGKKKTKTTEHVFILIVWYNLSVQAIWGSNLSRNNNAYTMFLVV